MPYLLQTLYSRNSLESPVTSYNFCPQIHFPCEKIYEAGVTDIVHFLTIDVNQQMHLLKHNS